SPVGIGIALTALSLAISFAFIFGAGEPTRTETAGKQGVPAENYWEPPGQGAQAPGVQGEQPLNPEQVKRFVTDAERGVKKGEARTTLNLTTEPGQIGFKPDRLEAVAGTVACVHFENRGERDQWDNFVLVKPGTERHVGLEAMRVGPKGGYIPVLPDEIIAHTAPISPGGSGTTCFRVPSEPGSYPFISTSRNRWTSMKGTLEVKKAG
ncbi:MAG TPA: hypothetical protein VM598_02025, partial [Bdellovibrionota bacterium]|nr:hypothetical protein [Bdellovibrionota bacterium]